MRNGPFAATAACSMAIVCGQALAGPLILEETSRIASPEAGFTLAQEVGVDGDSIIAVGARPLPYPDEFFDDLSAYLFQRNSNGTWSFVRKLTQKAQDSMIPYDMTVAMKQGIAAVSSAGLHVYENTAAGWVDAPTHGGPSDTDLEIDAGTVLASDGTCTWAATPFRKDASGTWSAFGFMFGAFRGCDDEFLGGDVDISGNTVIIFNDHTPDLPEPEARIYQGGATPEWPQVATLGNPEPGSDFGPNVALRNDTALVTGTRAGGTYIFHRDSSAAWSSAGTIQQPEALMSGRPTRIELRDGFALQSQFDAERNAGSIAVFERQSGGEFKYVAKLFARRTGHAETLDRSVDISGRRIVVSGTGAAYVFDLPEDFSQPPLVQEDFELGNASHWTPLAGGAFSVESSGTSSIYRQTSLAGNAASLLNDTDWRNQSIEVDVTPTAFSGPDRWFGLVVRYLDADNYYYVTVRSTNSIQLKRMRNGVYETLHTRSLPVALNQTYRLRLEAVGTFIRVYVDNYPVLAKNDGYLQHGQAGIMMYKTSADYDNIIVSPNPRTRLWQTKFAPQIDEPFTMTGDGQWSVVNEGGSTVFRQSSLVGGARAITGVSTDDQIVETRVRALAFNGNDRWVGVLARYVDDGNYYYVTLRSTNAISLRTLVNGTIHEIAQAPLTVTPGTWYALRLEAIGDSFRVYVNGTLTLQGADNSHPTGRFGLMTSKASASYDDFLAYQP